MSEVIKGNIYDGEIDFRSTTMYDFVEKKKPKSPRRRVKDDDCLIVGFSRDSLGARPQPRSHSDVLCPINEEYYKDLTKRIGEKYPKLKKLYFSEDIDPTPIDQEIQDLKRTVYHVEFCARDMPFMSVNLARRAKALQTLRLPDDIEIPDTTYLCSYRTPPREKIQPPGPQSLRPKYDPTLKKKLEGVLRVSTGVSSYGASISLLGKVILEKNPYGKPREEPQYGKWKDPYAYTYEF